MSSIEEGKFITAGGYETHYHEAGSGEDVLLLHGSGPGVSAWANWSNVLPVLAEEYHVMAPDSVGFGDTERAEPTEYQLKMWVDHIVAFMDETELEKPNVIGNSFGGALTISLADRYPDRINKGVLMGSAGTSMKMTDALADVWGYRGENPEEMRTVLEHLAYDTSIVTDDLVQMRYDTLNQNPEILEAWEEMFEPPFEPHVKKLTTPDERIREIQTPMLVVHGREDEVLPAEVSWNLLQLLPKADLHVFGECGHWTQIEKVDEFNQLVLDFFQWETET